MNGARRPRLGKSSSMAESTKTENPGNIMTRTARTIILSAAMAGLVAGTMATTGCKSSSDNSGKAAASSDSTMSKHDCKGMNSCKGQGGCSQSDNGCKGKNSCKGKGGCKVT
jgi:hypothetical protein